MSKETVNINIMPPEAIVAALKANNELVMKALYISNYKKTEAFVLQNSGTITQAKDIYQEAFIAVWRNIRHDRFTPQSDSSLNGYLYRIAKNKWIDYIRSARHRKTVSENELHLVPKADDEEAISDSVKEENTKRIMRAFGKLGEECKHLLQQFYFKRKKYKDLASELDMEEASVRNQKYRCMQKLRKLVQKIENK